MHHIAPVYLTNGCANLHSAECDDLSVAANKGYGRRSFADLVLQHGTRFHFRPVTGNNFSASDSFKVVSNWNYLIEPTLCCLVEQARLLEGACVTISTISLALYKFTDLPYIQVRRNETCLPSVLSFEVEKVGRKHATVDALLVACNPALHRHLLWRRSEDELFEVIDLVLLVPC